LVTSFDLSGGGAVDIATLTSGSGTSLVTASILIDVAGEGTVTGACDISGVGVSGTQIPFMVHSAPQGLSQITLFAQVEQDAVATVSCDVEGTTGTITDVDAFWAGGIGHTANTSEDGYEHNDFTLIGPR
jgi:hypothetical protein